MSLTIDVHHHILPDFFWQETNEGANPVGGIAPPPWDQAGMLSFMDDARIDVAVASISTPGVHVGDDARARALARRCNELAASMIQKRPDRFGGFAALPLPDVEGALNELAYAFDVLKLDGVVVFSNSNGVYLGDKRFEPVFEELERRRAVVFVHPTASPDPTAHQLGLPDTLIDFTADTTRAVAQMLYSDRFARTPNVKYILSHAGGVIPYLAGRFAIVDEMSVIPGAESRESAAATLRRLHYDTALSFSPPVLNMLRDVVGFTQVLFGTDNPYFRRDMAVRSAEHMRQTATLSESERQAVLHGNAQRLFPRLRYDGAAAGDGFPLRRASIDKATGVGNAAFDS
jgi:aminocarboxymuconate-semialdehyde decarboxylase